MDETTTFIPAAPRPLILAVACGEALLIRCRAAAAAIRVDLEPVGLLALL